MVIVLIFVGGPPHGVLGVLINNDILVLGGTAGINAGHDINGSQLAFLTLFVSGKTGLRLFLKEHFIRRIAHNFGNAGNTVLLQIDFNHLDIPLSFTHSPE